jgi:hypothetical protein
MKMRTTRGQQQKTSAPVAVVVGERDRQQSGSVTRDGEASRLGKPGNFTQPGRCSEGEPELIRSVRCDVGAENKEGRSRSASGRRTLRPTPADIAPFLWNAEFYDPGAKSLSGTRARGVDRREFLPDLSFFCGWSGYHSKRPAAVSEVNGRRLTDLRPVFLRAVRQTPGYLPPSRRSFGSDPGLLRLPIVVR